MRKVRKIRLKTGPAFVVGRWPNQMLVSKHPVSQKVWMLLANSNGSLGLSSTETRELYELLKAASRKGFFRS